MSNSKIINYVIFSYDDATKSAAARASSKKFIDDII